MVFLWPLVSEREDAKPRRETVQSVLGGALQYMLRLKAAWILGQYNRRHRIARGLLPADLAIGIHVGPVVEYDPREHYAAVSDSADPRSEFIGFSINVCKRIEGVARGGSGYNVFLSSEAVGYLSDACPDVIFSAGEKFELKGVTGRCYLMEVHEVVDLCQWLWQPTWAPAEQLALTFDDLCSASAVASVHPEAKGFRGIVAATLEYLRHAPSLSPHQVSLAERLMQKELLPGTYEASLRLAQQLVRQGRYAVGERVCQSLENAHWHPTMALAMVQCLCGMTTHGEQAEIRRFAAEQQTMRLAGGGRRLVGTGFRGIDGFVEF